MRAATAAAVVLRWNDLNAATKSSLSGKLDGLFGWPDTKEAFESLPINPQQALLLILGKFEQLDIWHTVRRVTNAYGEGGVGIEFTSWPILRSTLKRHPNFSTLLGGHRNNEGGFRERRKSRGPVLHVVMVKHAANQWAAHFDLYDPLFSVGSLWRHIYREGWRQKLPSWQQIGGPITE